MSSTIRTPAVLALLTLAAAGCDLFGPDVGPPTDLQKSALPTSLVAGESVQVSVTVKDDEDRAVSGTAVSWAASGSGSASPASSDTDGDGAASTRWTFDTTAGTQTLVATAGDIEITFTADVRPAALDEIVLDPVDATMESVGDTLVITATPLDRYGNQTPIAHLSWSSSAPSIASVEDGSVVSRAEGTVTITAASGQTSDDATVTVDQVVTGIGLVPGAPIMAVGESLGLMAQAVDARGSAVDTSLTVSWISSNAGVATVSNAGVVDALDIGSAAITATAGTLTGEAFVEVKAGPRPTITGISPALLAAGDTAIISGTDFSATVAENVVTVAGAAGTVLAASTGELTVELPAAGAFPCSPTGEQEVVVSVDGLDTSTTHPVAGAPQHTLPVGASMAFFGDDVACNELSDAGTYVVSVFSTSTSPVSNIGAQLRGAQAGAAMLTEGAAGPRIMLSTARPARNPDPELVGHLGVLETNIRLVERLGAPEPVVNRPTAAQELGDVRTFRIPDIEGSDVCAEYIEATARAVYSGTHAVIWEDTLSPVAGQMAATWEELGAEYDDVMHQTLLDYFGDPLVYDDRLDANGKFFMLFSETINDFQERPVSGFVFSGDFYARAECASSDDGEIFYGRVPTDPGTGYEDGQVGLWAWRMRSTVIHEVKHLTAYANKFDVGASALEESGLEEATARLAEEFYGRALQGYGQFDNVGYQESIACERQVGSSPCDDVPLIMHKHYNAINTYLKSPELLSPFGRVQSGDASFYGSGWQLVRWAIDHSGLTEADFIKPLVREPGLTGPDNLADKAGRPLPELLADYTLAFAVDDHPSGVAPNRTELSMPGWDTRDIFQGLHDGYVGTSLDDVFPTPWPLEPHSVSGSFEVIVPTIRGGSAAIFEATTTGPQLLQLLSESGGPASGTLGLAVVRVQ